MKTVVIHLSDQEHAMLKAYKNKLTWREYMLAVHDAVEHSAKHVEEV